MARPDTRKIKGLKKNTYKSLGERDTGMARPDTRKIGGLKKQKKGMKEKVPQKNVD